MENVTILSNVKYATWKTRLKIKEGERIVSKKADNQKENIRAGEVLKIRAKADGFRACGT